MCESVSEALLYELEYGTQLAGWPRAVVVAPIPVEAVADPGDTVVLEGWSRWPSPSVLAGLLDDLSRSPA